MPPTQSRKTAMRVLPLLLLTSLTFAQTVQFSVVPRATVEKRLEAFPTKNPQREPALRRIFEEAGCPPGELTEQPVKGLKAPNLICTFPGEMESEIVVGAHFDLEEAGQGVVDNWSGASLLPSLYEGLSMFPRRHSFRFVSFAGEEKGMLGSQAYVRQMMKTGETAVAMVNLDTLGLTESEVWVHRADPKLVKLLELTAAATMLPVSAMNVDSVGSTDSESFREKKSPAITIHSLTTETLPILHSSKDRLEAIHRDEYYRTYRLVLAYLAVLDHELD